MTADIRDLGDTMGRVPRPTARIYELLLTDYLYSAFGIRALALVVVSVWFLIRIVGFTRRRNSTLPPEEAYTIQASSTCIVRVTRKVFLLTIGGGVYQRLVKGRPSEFLFSKFSLDSSVWFR